MGVGPDCQCSTVVSRVSADRTLVEQVGVVRMPLDVAADERAPGHQRPTARPHVVEGTAGQRAADAPALELGEHLGVDEHPDPGLVAVLLGCVTYLGGHSGTLSGRSPAS